MSFLFSIHLNNNFCLPKISKEGNLYFFLGQTFASVELKSFLIISFTPTNTRTLKQYVLQQTFRQIVKHRFFTEFDPLSRFIDKFI